MKTIKNFEKFDKQDVIKEHKTLCSLLTSKKVNETVSEDPNEFNLNSVLASIKNHNVQIIEKPHFQGLAKIQQILAGIKE